MSDIELSRINQINSFFKDRVKFSFSHKRIHPGFETFCLTFSEMQNLGEWVYSKLEERRLDLESISKIEVCWASYNHRGSELRNIICFKIY